MVPGLRARQLIGGLGPNIYSAPHRSPACLKLPRHRGEVVGLTMPDFEAPVIQRSTQIAYLNKNRIGAGAREFRKESGGKRPRLAP